MLTKTNRRPVQTVLAAVICGMFATGTQVLAASPTLTNGVAQAPATTSQAAPEVANIDFRRGNDGAGRLVITFNGDGAMPDLRNQGNQVVVDLGRAQVPANLARSLDVTDFATPVRNVNTVAAGHGSQIVLNTNAAFESMAYQRGREYVVEVMPRTAQVAQGGLASSIAGASQAAASQTGARTYSGKRVNFNFQDIPVRPVLQLIAEDAGLNIVASDTVTGNVTLRLVDVPWDQALDLILQAKGLDKRREGNVIWVAPQAEIAKYEQDKEDARIALENRQDLITEYIRINYHSAEAIFKALTEAKGIGQQNTDQGRNESGFLSPRGRLVADERTNTLMVSDIPKKVEEMRRLINEIDRPVDQVVIESRIVVATESFARDLGARFGVSGSRSGNNSAGIGGSISSTGGSLPTGLNFSMPVTSGASLAYTLLGANFSLDMELSAMQTQGRGEVLSNPRVLTTNQREAVIRQGKEVAYVTTTATTGGVVTPTVSFKDVLMELRVTPTITNDDRVSLITNITKNEVESWRTIQNFGEVPIIAKREVNTSALVENGQTVVIGGVYEFTDSDSLSKVPFFGDIPVIGRLFQNRSRNNEKVELLVFMTPRILRVQQRQH